MAPRKTTTTTRKPAQKTTQEPKDTIQVEATPAPTPEEEAASVEQALVAEQKSQQEQQANAYSYNQDPGKVDPNVPVSPEDAERIGTLGAVFGNQNQDTVIVGAPQEVVPESVAQQMQMVDIRVNEAIEDMSIVGGGRRFRASFEPGRIYRVPYDVAIELERIGKVYH